MDAHFPSDTLVFAGGSTDKDFKGTSDALNPIVAAMNIDEPIYKWAKCASNIPNKYFFDVEISEDGRRIVAVAGNSG